MKKPFTAALIALLITACIAAPIVATAGSALVNKNTVPVSNTAAASSGGSVISSSEQANQIAQLQSLVSQYQDREQQYQQREQQLQEKLAQANAEIQQDQQNFQEVQRLLAALQQRGIIQLTSDGRILITQ